MANSGIQAVKHGQLARPPKVLAPLIDKDIADGDAAAEEASRPFRVQAGYKLCEAKRGFKTSGEFILWATKRFKRSQDTIRSWQIYAKNELNGGEEFDFESDTKDEVLSNLQNKDFPTLGSSVRPNPQKPRITPPSWFDPVKDEVSRIHIARLTAERQEREKELKLREEIAMKIITIGWKALSQEFHPDKGGSREGMTRLNDVKDQLKAAVRKGVLR